jgi:hypothetical protein
MLYILLTHKTYLNTDFCGMVRVKFEDELVMWILCPIAVFRTAELKACYVNIVPHRCVQNCWTQSLLCEYCAPSLCSELLNSDTVLYMTHLRAWYISIPYFIYLALRIQYLWPLDWNPKRLFTHNFHKKWFKRWNLETEVTWWFLNWNFCPKKRLKAEQTIVEKKKHKVLNSQIKRMLSGSYSAVLISIPAFWVIDRLDW